jgi:hypothetical protein
MGAKRRGEMKRRPVLEVLESVVLQSTATGVAPPAAFVSPPLIPLPMIVSLDGSGRGTYHARQANPDLPTTYSVSTVARFSRYGAAVVTGALQQLGFVASGQATGTLRVILPGGTVTLSLTGPTQPGFSSLPREFQFVVVKGTGRFHNAVGDPVGKGVVDVSLKPSPRPGGAGVVTLTFHSLPVAIA